jgi:hypothetical protein
MAPKCNKNVQEELEIEGKIEIAISDYKNGRILSLHKASEIYEVSYSRLYRRHRNIQNQATSNAIKRRMTRIEEDTLIKWITSIDKRGYPVGRQSVGDMASYLLSHRDMKLTTECVGINWVDRFLARHPEVKKRISRPISAQRAKCEDPKILREWFNCMKQAIMDHGILDEDIYNFDETGFAMGLCAKEKVITGAETNGRPFLIMPGQREWVTPIETVNAAGWALPPYIIFKGVDKIAGWFEGNAYIPGQRIQTRQNGWTTDEIGID